MMGPYGWPGGGMGWGGWLAMGFALLIFCALVVIGIVLLVRSLGHHRGLTAQPSAASAALHSLDGRSARGEIDTDEYNRRR